MNTAKRTWMMDGEREEEGEVMRERNKKKNEEERVCMERLARHPSLTVQTRPL